MLDQARDADWLSGQGCGVRSGVSDMPNNNTPAGLVSSSWNVLEAYATAAARATTDVDGQSTILNRAGQLALARQQVSWSRLVLMDFPGSVCNSSSSPRDGRRRAGLHRAGLLGLAGTYRAYQSNELISSTPCFSPNFLLALALVQNVASALALIAHGLTATTRRESWTRLLSPRHSYSAIAQHFSSVRQFFDGKHCVCVFVFVFFI
jgi:hypothetical protein